jgi:tetratricopeptide (TPR) repeat protein
LAYAQHRLGAEDAALYWLRRALDLDENHAEARIYLGNLLYDRGEYDAALFHFEQTVPEEHVDELALWRTIELKKSIYRLPAGDPELVNWQRRLSELTDGQDPDDQFLAELLAVHLTGAVRDPRQLELFGTLLTELQGMRRRPGEVHRVSTARGVTYSGTWEEIVLQMKIDDRDGAGSSMVQYMEQVAMRSQMECGVVIPITDAESFVRGAEQAGIVTILR